MYAVISRADKMDVGNPTLMAVFVEENHAKHWAYEMYRNFAEVVEIEGSIYDISVDGLRHGSS